MRIIGEERNRLVRVLISYIGGGLWKLKTVGTKTGEREVEYFNVKGEDNDVRRLLMRMKASDTSTEPFSKKRDRLYYKKMVADAKNGVDNEIWVFTSKWNKYKNTGVKLPEARLSEGFREIDIERALELIRRQLEKQLGVPVVKDQTAMEFRKRAGLDQYGVKFRIMDGSPKYKAVRFNLENRNIKKAVVKKKIGSGDILSVDFWSGNPKSIKLKKDTTLMSTINIIRDIIRFFSAGSNKIIPVETSVEPLSPVVSSEPVVPESDINPYADDKYARSTSKVIYDAFNNVADIHVLSDMQKASPNASGDNARSFELFYEGDYEDFAGVVVHLNYPLHGVRMLEVSIIYDYSATLEGLSDIVREGILNDEHRGSDYSDVGDDYQDIKSGSYMGFRRSSFYDPESMDVLDTDQMRGAYSKKLRLISDRDGDVVQSKVFTPQNFHKVPMIDLAIQVKKFIIDMRPYI